MRYSLDPRDPFVPWWRWRARREQHQLRRRLDAETCDLALRHAALASEPLSGNRVRWIERLPPYDTPEFDALSSAPPLAEESVARNTEGRMSITDRQVSGFIKRHHAPPAPPQPVRRGSYADHRLQFPEMYVKRGGDMTEHNRIYALLSRDDAPLVPPAPAPAALLACLTILLDQRLSLDAILLIAETRGVGAGKVALELATKMAAAGIGAR